MSFARVFSRSRTARIFPMMPMIAIPVAMMISITAMSRRGGAAFLRVLKVGGVDDAFRRMRTRLVILESVEVTKFLATIGLRAFKVLAAGGHDSFGAFTGIEAKSFGERRLIVLGVGTPVEREQKRYDNYKS